MFRFKNSRSTLVKRLLKQRIVQCPSNHHHHHHHRNNNQNEEFPARSTEEELEALLAVAQSMLKRLKESQLESLARAVESRGAEPSQCVLVPRGDMRLGRRGTIAPHIICCQLWRWPDVRDRHEIKSLHWCSHSATTDNHDGVVGGDPAAADDDDDGDPLYVCVNPYHWSRVYKPGMKKTHARRAFIKLAIWL